MYQKPKLHSDQLVRSVSEMARAVGTNFEIYYQGN